MAYDMYSNARDKVHQSCFMLLVFFLMEKLRCPTPEATHSHLIQSRITFKILTKYFHECIF